MKLIGFQKHPGQPLGQEFADGAFSRTGDSHEEKYHSWGPKIGRQTQKNGRAEFRALRGASPAIVREVEYTSCACGGLQDGPAQGHFRGGLVYSYKDRIKSAPSLFRVLDLF